jgi:hypothetical protein
LHSIIVEGYYEGRGRDSRLHLNIYRVHGDNDLRVLESNVEFKYSDRPQIWKRLERYLHHGEDNTVQTTPPKTVQPKTVQPKQPTQATAGVAPTTHDRFTNGAFVMWNARLHSNAMDPQDARDMALAAGLPEEIVPEYAGDRAILSRVIDGQAARLKRRGWVLSSLKRKSSHLLMTIHRASKDVDARVTDLPQVGTLEWLAEPKDSKNNGYHNEIISDHEVGTELNALYQGLRGKITGQDWTTTLVDYLTNECYAQSWRQDGRVYWVPPIGLPAVRELQTWLKTVGVSLAVAEIDSEVRESVAEVVETSLVDQLEELAAEVEAFDGTQKPSTYADRLERYHLLRKRAIVHTETLGIAKETAQEILNRLDEMESKVDTMLEERKQVRVKRDGTIEYL